jgi:beta-lactamase class A
MYRVANNQLINKWVSLQMKALLGRQLDISKLAAGLPSGSMFSHKTGWWSVYTHDVGIVEAEKTRYVIAVFLPVKEELLGERMKLLAQKIDALMRTR